MNLFTHKKQTKNGDSIPFLHNHKDSLERSRRDSLSQLYTLFMELKESWQKEALQEIKTLVSCCKALEETQKGKTVVPGLQALTDPPLRFVTSSLFLKELWDFLISHPKGYEELVILTGPVTPDVFRVLSQIIHVEKEIQSAGHVQAADSTHFKLIDLNENHGHRQFATAHSHTMFGRETTRPSGVDLALQSRLVTLGDDSIGIIVNLDGYIRVYSTWKTFEFHTHGKGIEEIENKPKMKVFRFVQPDKENVHVAHQTPAAPLDKRDNPAQTNLHNNTAGEEQAEGVELQPVEN